MPSTSRKAQRFKHSGLYIGLTALSVAVVGLALWATSALLPKEMVKSPTVQGTPGAVGQPAMLQRPDDPARFDPQPAGETPIEPNPHGAPGVDLDEGPTAEFDASHDGRASEHVQSPEETVAMIDRVIARLEEGLRQYEAEGNEERARLVRTRIERLQRERAKHQTDAGP